MTANAKCRLSNRILISPVFALALALGCATSSATPPSGSPAKPDAAAAWSVEADTPLKATPAVFHPVKGIDVELSSDHVIDGGMLMAKLTWSFPKKLDPTGMTIHFEENEFYFYPLESDLLSFEALIAIPHNKKPGNYELTVKTGATTGPIEFKIPLTVVDGRYKSETLHVAPKLVNPPPKEMKRIKKEQHELGEMYKLIRREKLWKGPFIMPVESIVTSPYGGKRLYNGELAGAHLGLDLRAQVGTPIYAPAGGVVVMAKNLYYTGNTVILDHGYGIFTIYAHMSKLKVKKGMKVEPKKLLGLAGMTGRVTGPHLHWGAVIQHVRANPQDLMRVLR